MTTEPALDPLLAPIHAHMEQVERVLYDTLDDVEEPLRAKLRHVLAGGKRLRPALAILTGQVFLPPSAPFYRLAAAVEMLHTATLIHDDLVDGTSTRRGREALHVLWPVGMTVLAGDYLLARSALLIAELGHPRILAVFAGALCTICAGEIGQAVAAGQPNYREAYHRSIEAKTASLCAAITEMSALLAGADEAQVAALRCFGRELGIAFQMADDVLDFVGDEEQLGKPAGSDLRQGLLTLPTLCYLEQEGEHGDDGLVRAVLAGWRDAEQVGAAIAAIRASGALDAALAEARVHARQAQEVLGTLPDNGPRQDLSALAEYAVQRRR